MNKKGMWEPPRSIPSLVLGLLVFMMGIFPILNNFGVISFNLPYSPAGTILAIILVIGGLWLAIMGIGEEDFLKAISITLGIFAFILGALPLMANFGMVITIPFLSFLYSPYLYVILGILLMISTYATEYI